MRSYLDTAGERVAIDCGLSWVADLIREGSAGGLDSRGPGGASVSIQVEASGEPFALEGFRPLTRGAWQRDGEVVLENACAAGFDVHVRAGPHPELTYRWRPPRRDRALARLLRSRFHLLARALLLQYPALWCAGTRGRVPLHASACTAGASTVLIGAAGGIGRSTLLLEEVGAGGLCTGDNLAVTDGTIVWGLVEPLRIEGGDGRRMLHGRREALMPERVGSLIPDCLVVLAREATGQRRLVPCGADAAARSLVAGTYMAGELRRYWAFAATLSAGTGAGPPHPPVTDVAQEIAERLSCFRLTLGPRPGARLARLLRNTPEEVAA
jgi:hypothetical protein